MDIVSLILVIVGAVNWGLVGFAKFDLVAWIFGGQTASFSREALAENGADAVLEQASDLEMLLRL